MKHSQMGYTARRRVSLPALRGGIDRSRPAHLIRDDRLHEATNVWWRDGLLRTRPALRRVSTATGTAQPAVTSFTDCAVVYAATGDTHRLAVLDADGVLHGTTFTDDSVTGVTAVSTDGAAAVLYLGGSREVKTLTNGGKLTAATPYVPCVLSTGRATKTKRREESGALIEPINLLTPAYTCRYTTDGEGIYYWLPDTANVGFDAPLNITYTTAAGVRHSHTVPPAADVRRETGSSTDGYFAVYEPSVRCFYFTDKDKKPVALPMADAADNLVLSAECVDSERFRRIYAMPCAVRFGGRVFVGGDPAAPHRIHWSAVDNALYFPESNEAIVGEATDGITAFGKQGDALVIFKRYSIYAMTEYTDPVTAADVQSGAENTQTGVWFPVRCIHSEIGCPHPATVRLCGDRLVWMGADARVYVLCIDGTYDAKRVRPISHPVEPLSAAHVSAVCYGDRYVLFSDDGAWVLDYSDTGHPSVDDEDAVWFRWTFPHRVTAANVGDSTYVLQAADGAWRVYTLDESNTYDADDVPIAVRIVTKQYEGGTPERYKQLCAMTFWMQGDVAVSVVDGAQTVASARLTDTAGTPRRMATPAMRLKRYGLVLEGTGEIAIDRIQTVYRRMGEIRE